jgi:hypothetical protein
MGMARRGGNSWEGEDKGNGSVGINGSMLSVWERALG